MACKRTGSVSDYQDRFKALLPRVGALSEAQQVQAFTPGLQPPLSLDIEVHNPQSLVVATSLARKLELREQSRVMLVYRLKLRSNHMANHVQLSIPLRARKLSEKTRHRTWHLAGIELQIVDFMF